MIWKFNVGDIVFYEEYIHNYIDKWKKCVVIKKYLIDGYYGYEEVYDIREIKSDKIYNCIDPTSMHTPSNYAHLLLSKTTESLIKKGVKETIFEGNEEIINLIDSIKNLYQQLDKIQKNITNNKIEEFIKEISL